MPANRSRTERWLDCLRQMAQREGAIEVTIPTSKGATGQSDSSEQADLIWRVRIVSVTDDEIVVEQPNAAGQPIELAPGVPLIAVMAIGQNRWMFRTSVLPALPRTGTPTRSTRSTATVARRPNGSGPAATSAPRRRSSTRSGQRSSFASSTAAAMPTSWRSTSTARS